MNHLEDRLRRSLCRKEPPPGFAERLLASIAAQPPGKLSRWQTLFSLWQLPRVRWATACVAACLMVGIGVAQYRSYQRIQAEGEQAKTQLILALKIAGDKLNFAQRKIQEIHQRGPQPGRTESP